MLGGDGQLESSQPVPLAQSGVRMDNLSQSNLSHCPTASEEQLHTMEQLSFLLEGCVLLVLCCLGLVGNTLSIFLLARPDLRSPFNQLLQVLACFDLVYLVTMLLEASRKLGVQTHLQIVIFPQFLHPLNAISMMCSIYLTVGVALERYMAVYNPMAYNRRQVDTTSHRHHLLSYLLPIFIFAVLFNITKFFESKVVYYTEEDNTTSLYLDITDLRLNDLYVTWYVNWARLAVLGVLPLSLLTFLNYNIYMAVRRRMKSRHPRGDHLSVVLMMIVTVFVLCNLPRVILNMHEITVLESTSSCQDTELGGFPVWSIILGFFSHIFLVINSSINLLIYCLVGEKFRTVFCQVICRKAQIPCRCTQLTSENGHCVACGKRLNRLQTNQRSSRSQPSNSPVGVDNAEDMNLIPIAERVIEVQENDSMEKCQDMKTSESTPKANRREDTTIEVSTQVPTVTEL